MTFLTIYCKFEIVLEAFTRVLYGLPTTSLTIVDRFAPGSRCCAVTTNTTVLDFLARKRSNEMPSVVKTFLHTQT